MSGLVDQISAEATFADDDLGLAALPEHQCERHGDKTPGGPEQHVAGRRKHTEHTSKDAHKPTDVPGEDYVTR